MVSADPQKSRRARWIGVLLVIIGLLGMAGIVAVALLINTVKAAMPPQTTVGEAVTEAGKVVQAVTVEDPAPMAFGDRQTLNILVLGIDYDYTDSDQPFSKNARSDTIFVLQVRRDGKYLGLLSMPRDMYVEFPDGSHDKVNSAYSRGGVKLERQMLTNFLGTDFDHYAVIHIDGATRLIDRVGGLDIDVEKDMNYDDNWGHLHVHLKKGPQHLDGAQAVGYARFRHDEEGDRGRMRRQKVVIDAMMQKLTAASTYANPVSMLADMARLTRQSIETDFTTQQLVALGKVYMHFDPHDLRSAQLDGRDGSVSGMSVIFPPQNDQVTRVVDKVIRPEGAPPPALDVEVFNGSPVVGAAQQLKDKLETHGFNVVFVDDGFHRTAHNMAVVYNAADDDRRRLSDLLGGALTFEEPTQAGGNWGANPNSADVSIVLGADYGKKSSPSATASTEPQAARRP